jgi:hypothetical protein
MWSSFNDEIQASSVFSDDTKAVTQNVTNRLPSYWDNGFLLLIVIIYITILIFIWFIDIHPAFLVLTIISAILLAVVGGIMNNITETMIKSESLATTTANFPILVFFAEHFGIVTFVMILGVLIVMFAKWRARQE